MKNAQNELKIIKITKSLKFLVIPDKNQMHQNAQKHLQVKKIFLNTVFCLVDLRIPAKFHNINKAWEI